MQNPSFGFGASGTQPASTGLFGATTTNTSTGGLFGTQNTSAFGTGAGLFGSTNTTTTTAPTLFGTTSTPNFGATSNVGGFGSAQPTALGFNAAATTASAFGATSTAPPAFGSTLTSTATPGFGATATAAVAPTFGSALTSTATSTPAFGASQGLGGTVPSFGATTTAAPTFGATATAAPTFGATSSAAPTFGATSSAAPTFGATSTAPTLFGLTSTAAASTAATTSTGLGFNLGTTPTTVTTASAPVGLGGLATTQTKVVAAQKDVTPKDQPLPNEILQTVESFKEFVKQQKVHSSEIAKCSIRDFRKVEQDIIQLTALLGEVESQLQKNRQMAENLKYDTARCLKDVEIAQRTQDTPPGLQYENTAPLKFFLNLADKFERDMQILKLQIEGADHYAKNYRSPNPLTPQDLALGMRRLHESFVALAGRLHSVHSQVESQKEAYLQLKKQLYNDHTNPFESFYKPEESFKHILNYSPSKVATGPTPFTNLALGNTQMLALQQNQNTVAYPITTTASGFAFGTTFAAQPAQNATQLFGSSFAQNSTNFQLQKPPTGNKRGKP